LAWLGLAKMWHKSIIFLKNDVIYSGLGHGSKVAYY